MLQNHLMICRKSLNSCKTGDSHNMSIFSGNKKTRKRLTRPTKIQVARSQNFMCYGCKLQIRSGDVFDVYHKDRNLSNNNITNLTVVHVKCHKGIDKKKSRDAYPKF